MPRPLALILVAFGLLAGLYSVTTPAFETPDEIWHFAYVHHLRTQGSLPVSQPDTPGLWRQQGVQAPGYYLLAALVTAWVDVDDFPAIYARANPHAALGRPDAPTNRNYLIHHFDQEGFPWQGTFLALHLARFLSVVLAGVTLWAVHGTLTPFVGPGRALGATALLAATPQFLFIGAAASNDNAIQAGAALVLWQVTRTLTGPREAWHAPGPWLRLGVFLGLALLAKLSGLGLVGVVGLAILWAAWQVRSVRLGVWAVLWVAGPALLIAGWWYARNALLYGDPLAWNIWRENILLRIAPADWRTILGELEGLERSYWGLFGWFNVPYPGWVYGLFRVVEGVALVGLVVAGVRWVPSGLRGLREDRDRTAAAGLLLLWLLVLTLSWLRFMRIAPAAQGRYFFPAASSLLLLWVWSCWWGLGPRLGRIWATATVAGLAVLALVTPFWILRPAYTPPPMRPATDTPPLAVFGLGRPQVGLVAVDGVPSQIRPGQAITLDLTWRVLGRMERDYSVFVHLVDPVGIPVAQVDTLPGGGLWATSRWRPGTELRDRYVLRVPETVYTPSQVRWVVGLYHAPSGERLAQLQPLGPPEQTEALIGHSALVPREESPVPNPIQVAFADNISLVGYAFSHRRLTPGQPVTVTLYWQARGPVSQEYTTFAHLLDGQFAMFGGHDGVPSPPTSAWLPGQVVEDVHTFQVPPETPPGLYRFEVGLYTRPDLRRLAVLDPAGAEGADRVILGPVRVE